MFEPLKKYEWKCPVSTCIYSISAYSEGGLATMRGFHEDSHRRLREQALGPEPEEQEKEPKDVNVLDLTLHDRNFLKTRHIKAD
jgi:hypothetical protein